MNELVECKELKLKILSNAVSKALQILNEIDSEKLDRDDIDKLDRYLLVFMIELADVRNKQQKEDSCDLR